MGGQCLGGLLVVADTESSSIGAYLLPTSPLLIIANQLKNSEDEIMFDKEEK